MYTVITSPEWMLVTSTEANAHSSNSQCRCSWSGWNAQQFHCGHFASMWFCMAVLKHFQHISTDKGLCRKSDRFVNLSVHTMTHVMHLSIMFWYCSDSCWSVASGKTCDTQFVFTVSWFPWLSTVCTALSSWPRRGHNIPIITEKQYLRLEGTSELI